MSRLFYRAILHGKVDYSTGQLAGSFQPVSITCGGGPGRFWGRKEVGNNSYINSHQYPSVIDVEQA